MWFSQSSRVSLNLSSCRNSLAISYFALSLNTANLHGNTYFNCFLSALVEIPAYSLSWLMFRCCPRRLSIFPMLFLCGVVLLIINFLPAGRKIFQHLSECLVLSKILCFCFPTALVYVSITLEMIGKFAVTTAYALVYAYTAEVYPTVLRTTAVGACSMASRIGGIISPFFIYLRKYQTFAA